MRVLASLILGCAAAFLLGCFCSADPATPQQIEYSYVLGAVDRSIIPADLEPTSDVVATRTYNPDRIVVTYEVDDMLVELTYWITEVRDSSAISRTR